MTTVSLSQAGFFRKSENFLLFFTLESLVFFPGPYLGNPDAEDRQHLESLATCYSFS